MNKFIVLAFMLIITSTSAFAQKSQRQMNREYGKKYREIGRDSSLSGYEKGQKKQELALKQRQDNIDYNKENYPSHHHDADHRDKRKKDMERKIDRLEDRYKRDKEKIENNDRLSKREKRAQKKILEKEYKAKKDILKREKDALK